jgi:uncharacterized membrane protein
MRSWLSLLVLAACGADGVPPADEEAPPTDPDVCESSYLTYDNFGAEFSANWCRGCHASAIPEDGRQGAPINVNFDSDADLRHWADRIRVRATGDTPTMPPAGGPGAAERALLVEWIDCGMN